MAGRRLSPARVAAIGAVPAALAAGIVFYGALGGFSRPATGNVSVPAPSLDEPTARVCRTFVGLLPDAVGRLARRPVWNGPEQNAAYGDPPVTVVCGAAGVPSVPPTATVYPLSGVCWYASDDKDATVWTSLYRAVPVQVRVPRAYDQPGQLVIQFSGPVQDGDPAVAVRPSGC